MTTDPMTDPMTDPATSETPWREPMPFRLLLDEAGRQARRHWASLYWAVALPLAAFQAMMTIFAIAKTREIGAVALGGTGELSQIFSLYGSLWGVLTLTYGVQILAYTTMGAAAVDAVAGRPISIGRRFLFTIRPGVLATIVPTTLATGLGLACCLLPGLGLVMIFGLMVPVMVEEGPVLVAALGRGRDLALYNPRRRMSTSPAVKILVLVVVGYLLSLGVSMTVQAPFGILQQVMIFRDAASGGDIEALAMDNPWQWLSVPAALFGSLAQTLVVVYVSLGTALLYFDVRNRREGRDLETALAQMEGNTG